VSSSEIDAGPALHCAAHPGTETYLRCAQCDTPICPRCLVQTPVGAKCPKCARGKLQPAFIMTPVDVVIAFATSVVASVLLGLIASVLLHVLPFVGGLLLIFFPIGLGMALADLIGRVVPRKHGTILKVAAGLGVVIGFLCLGMGDFIVAGPVELIQSGVYLSLLRNLLVGMVLNPFNLLFLGLGVWVAVYRTN
jgi:hypothetical protein